MECPLRESSISLVVKDHQFLSSNVSYPRDAESMEIRMFHDYTNDLAAGSATWQYRSTCKHFLRIIGIMLYLTHLLVTLLHP